MRPGQAFRQLLRSRSGLARRSLASSALALGTLLVLGCVPGAERREASAPPRWTSRAIPEAKGEIKEVDGQRVQIRYKDEVFSAITTNFERWPTYSYNDTRKFPPPNRTPMPAVKGDPRRGRELFMSRQKAPCTGCHLIPGDDVWPAGRRTRPLRHRRPASAGPVPLRLRLGRSRVSAKSDYAAVGNERHPVARGDSAYRCI